MQISLKVGNLDSVRQALDKLSGPQARVAYAKALNDTAFKVRKEMQAELRSVFDQPTSFITSAPKVSAATPEKLAARIAPTLDTRNTPSTGGKVGVDPQQVLQAQEFGGTRRDKKSEVVLRRAGILPGGYQTAIPKVPYPGSDDGKGNIRGAFMVQLLSYLQSFQEGQGYKANMTDKRKRSIQRGTAKSAGRRYFVSYGRLRSGKTQHLAPGIWAASGSGGVDVRPVLMFVRPASYNPRLDMDRIASRVDVDNYLASRVRFRIREAAGV